MTWSPSSPPGILDPTAHPSVIHVGLWSYSTVGLGRGSYPLHELLSPPHEWRCDAPHEWRCDALQWLRERAGPGPPAAKPPFYAAQTRSVGKSTRSAVFKAKRMHNISELQNKIGKLYFYWEGNKNQSLKTAVILRKDSLFNYEYFWLVGERIVDFLPLHLVEKGQCINLKIWDFSNIWLLWYTSMQGAL